MNAKTEPSANTADDAAATAGLRYSMHPTDPGYANWQEGLRVTVDGKEVQNVTMADVGAGVAVGDGTLPNGRVGPVKYRGAVVVKAPRGKAG